jgi:hypothetical protein
MEKLIRIRGVQALDGFKVRLQFTDDTEKVVDLQPFLRGPVFQPLQDDPKAFAAVKVDPQLGTIVWDNGADIDPDVLYYGLKPAWMEREQESPH